MNLSDHVLFSFSKRGKNTTKPYTEKEIASFSFTSDWEGDYSGKGRLHSKCATYLYLQRLETIKANMLNTQKYFECLLKQLQTAK